MQPQSVIKFSFLFFFNWLIILFCCSSVANRLGKKCFFQWNYSYAGCTQYNVDIRTFTARSVLFWHCHLFATNSIFVWHLFWQDMKNGQMFSYNAIFLTFSFMCLRLSVSRLKNADWNVKKKNGTTSVLSFFHQRFSSPAFCLYAPILFWFPVRFVSCFHLIWFGFWPFVGQHCFVGIFSHFNQKKKKNALANLLSVFCPLGIGLLLFEPCETPKRT